MFELRLLVVEDEQSQLNTWNEKIELHNAEAELHGFFITQTQVKSLNDAKVTLENNDYDAAVIDLRLDIERGRGPNDHGNQVLKLVLENELAVMAIFSAEVNLADIPQEHSGVINVFRKGGDGGGTANLMSWLISQSPLIKNIKEVQRDIKREMAKLFTKSIWPRWNNWTSGDSQSSIFLKSALTRHLTAYIYASFLEKSNQKVHPEEWYFVPPIRTGIKTGDIIKNADGSYEIIITPRCDLAREGKNETYQLVQCKIVSTKWKELCDNFKNKSADLTGNQNAQRTESLEKKVKSAAQEIRNFTQHNSNSSIYHFLPELKLNDNETIGPFLVEFDKLRSIKRTDEGVQDQLSSARIAAIAPEFLPSLVERLGAFFSRFGTPDYSHHD